jgi:membrane glycosyltransferase
MVAAYLRGLLKPSKAYGLRSTLAESAILEAISADASADMFELHAKLDAMTLPVLNEKGIRANLRSMGQRAARSGELRLLDIYRLSRQLEDKARADQNKNTLSLYQLYHLAAKNGIFDALSAREAEYAEANGTDTN